MAERLSPAQIHLRTVSPAVAPAAGTQHPRAVTPQ